MPNKPVIIMLAHAFFRNGKPSEGPYTSVVRALEPQAAVVEMIRIPLVLFKDPILWNEKEIKIPEAIGDIAPLKYIVDAVFTVAFIIAMCFKHPKEEIIMIGVDALMMLPAALLGPLLGVKAVFYCVDFSKTRFENPTMQQIYEFVDKWAGKLSDQTWAVCHNLKDYKEKNHEVPTIYIPNSFPFDQKHYEKNKDGRTLNKVVWTGSTMTPKHLEDVVKTAKALQEMRPELEIWLVPSHKIPEFKKAVKKYDLENVRFFDVVGQEASRQIVSQCDLGIAVYDKDFGSTEFIEPIKPWEYLMCGLPYIISCEPSVNPELVEKGVAYMLGEDNSIPQDGSLEKFISPEALAAKIPACLEMAKKYDAKKIMWEALEKLKQIKRGD